MLLNEALRAHLVDPIVDGVELTGWGLRGEGPVAVGPLLLLAHHHVPLLVVCHSVMYLTVTISKSLCPES